MKDTYSSILAHSNTVVGFTRFVAPPVGAIGFIGLSASKAAHDKSAPAPRTKPHHSK
jgi:hypothetical protein